MIKIPHVLLGLHSSCSCRCGSSGAHPERAVGQGQAQPSLPRWHIRATDAAVFARVRLSDLMDIDRRVWFFDNAGASAPRIKQVQRPCWGNGVLPACCFFLCDSR